MASVIRSIQRKSPAARTLLRPGDTVVSVNGHEIADVLDYKFYTYDEKLTLEAIGKHGWRKRVRIRKDAGEDPGIEFEDYLMDEARHCANKCVFCFVDQLPKGMRKTLYFKDDDARLSFLLGNYITLTNLREDELQRMIDQRISPINVSVHATDPEMRVKLLTNPKAAEGYAIMQRLAEAGIVMNCQIVLCPGLNDGAQLQRSMEDLRALYPQVESVSVVPVGLTKHREGLCPLTGFTKETALETLAQVNAFGDKCLEETGTRIFFCSDELYLKAELPIPGEDYYEIYPQLENGVGMLRLLMCEFEEALEDAGCDAPQPFTVATGVSAAPFIEKLSKLAAEKFPGLEGTVYAVENDHFGHSIDVAGLVTGGDLIRQLTGKKLAKRLLIPQNMLRHGEGVFLDDVTVEDVERALQVTVVQVPQDGAALLEAMLDTKEE